MRRHKRKRKRAHGPNSLLDSKQRSHVVSRLRMPASGAARRAELPAPQPGELKPLDAPGHGISFRRPLQRRCCDSAPCQQQIPAGEAQPKTLNTRRSAEAAKRNSIAFRGAPHCGQNLLEETAEIHVYHNFQQALAEFY